MSASVQPAPRQWPLRPDASSPRRDWNREFLALERVPGSGKVSGLSVAIAGWLDVDVLLVRALFVVTALSSGLGLMVYLAGWLLTRDARTGAAPLDRIGMNWHQLSARVVVAWALTLSVLFALTFGSALGTGWFGVVVLALTAWFGWGSRQRTCHRVVVRPSAPLVTSPVMPDHGPVAGVATAQPGNTTVLALGALIFAGLVAGLIAVGQPQNDVLPWAGALLMIGIGLVLIAWRGKSTLLILSGILLAAALVTTVVLQSATLDRIVPTSQADLSDVVFTGTSHAIDLTRIDLATDSNWQITVLSSALEFSLPPAQNVEVEVHYTDSLVRLLDSWQAGDGTATYRRTAEPDGPVLKIVLDLTSSVVWMPS